MLRIDIYQSYARYFGSKLTLLNICQSRKIEISSHIKHDRGNSRIFISLLSILNTKKTKITIITEMTTITIVQLKYCRVQ